MPHRRLTPNPTPDLAAALAALPDKQRQSVAYHYLAGLPYAEVAAILGGTAEAARRAAADGIATLRVRQPTRHRSTDPTDRTEHSMSTEHELTATLHAGSRRRPRSPPSPPRAARRRRRSRAPPRHRLPHRRHARSAACCWPRPRPDWSGSPTPARTTTRVLQSLSDRISPRILHHPARLDAAARELDEYFAGRRRTFDLDLDWRLSAGFRATVLRHLSDIGYGHTASYADGRPARRQPQGRPRRRHRVRHQPAARRRALPPRRPLRRQHGRLPRRGRGQGTLLELEAAA